MLTSLKSVKASLNRSIDTKHSYKEPADVQQMTPDEIYDLSPREFSNYIMDDPNKNRLLSSQQQKALQRMLAIKREEKRLSSSIPVDRLKQTRKNFIDTYKGKTPAVDRLILDTKYQETLPELREKANQLKSQIELEDRFARLKDTRPDENSENKQKLKNLQRQIREIEETISTATGGKTRTSIRRSRKNKKIKTKFKTKQGYRKKYTKRTRKRRSRSRKT